MMRASDLADARALGDGLRRARLRVVEPVDPGAAGDGGW